MVIGCITRRMCCCHISLGSRTYTQPTKWNTTDFVSRSLFYKIWCSHFLHLKIKQVITFVTIMHRDLYEVHAGYVRVTNKYPSILFCSSISSSKDFHKFIIIKFQLVQMTYRNMVPTMSVTVLCDQMVMVVHFK